MPETAGLSNAFSALILLMPFAVLLVLLALLLRQRPRRGETAAEPPPAPPPSTVTVVAEPIVTAAEAQAPLAFVDAAPPDPLPASTFVAPPQPEPEPETSAEPQPDEEDDMIRHIGPIPDPKSPDELLEDIRVAERAGNHALLARLCLELAQSDPSGAHAPETLRKCVRSAMRSKSFAIHAAARLELAERARMAGDLTTACEHWQIARGLFFDMNDRELHKTAEGLMLRHGCPTDWVLTDF